MLNYIVYHASSVDEVYECSYSLLKYLDIYNLKPPADHGLVIYTGKPAYLEAYGSFLNHFELKDVPASVTGSSKLGLIRSFAEQHPGNILYLDPNTYPVKELEGLFSSVAQGSVHAAQRRGEGKEEFAALGLNAKSLGSENNFRMPGQIKGIDSFIAQYQDLKEFRLLLRNFFGRYQEESIPNQVKLIHHTDAAEIQTQKRKFQQLPLYVRLLRKMVGKGWSISNYSRRI
jgi:hypothetical protein